MLIAIIVIVILVALVGFGIMGFNKLRTADIGAQEALGGIDVQLTRRAELIPNLVETVKGYAAHEQATLEKVIQARNMALQAPNTPHAQAEADNQLTGALKSIFALGEAYPDLKANQNFLQLQEELTATEGRVAYSRQFYNDSVLDYNNKLEQFPTMFFAQMLKMQRREYFQAEEAARDVPDVSF